MTTIVPFYIPANMKITECVYKDCTVMMKCKCCPFKYCCEATKTGV